MAELGMLIKEWSKIEVDKAKNISKLTGLASACYSRGIEPFKETEKVIEIKDNDVAFALM